jgi:hypothetical protein
MELRGTLSKLPKDFRILVCCFVIVLNIGFFTGFNFVRVSTSLSANGIEQNYLGNEEDEEADIMRFKKSEKEILTLIHNHILSLSVVFFVLAILLYMTNVSPKLKTFLLFEPFASLVLTFGGIYIMWLGVIWFKYIIIISGLAMVLSLCLTSLLIIKECLFPKVK